MRPRLLLTLLTLAALVLGGCIRPPSLVGAPGALNQPTSPTTLQGRVSFGDRTSQAVSLENDIAPGATVSLIETQSQTTAGATVTTSTGDFVLSFGASFNPEPGRSYYLEAVKGIKGPNEQYNQAGAEAVRLRTLVYFRGGWVSLTNAQPGLINLNKNTTALAAMVGLRTLAGEPVDTDRLIGCLAADQEAMWTAPGFPFTRSAFDAVVLMVGNALDFDQDPLRYLTYSRDTGDFRKTGTVFSFTGISLTVGRIGAAVTIAGTGFNMVDPSKNLIRFNGALVPSNDVYVYDNGTKIDAHVPAGATSGPVSLEIGGTVLAGPTFTVVGGDGHDALDDQGRLLVVNRDFGTLSRVTADGTVVTLGDTGLDTPRSLTYDRADKKLYVACYGTGTIVQFDMSSGDPTSPLDWVSVPHPTGLAIGADGYLYVASYDEGQISRFKLSDKTPGTTFTGFDSPVGLAFDFNGDNLYVSEQGAANRVTRLAIADGSRLTWAYVGTPWGLAVDSGGTVFVAANTGNALLRIAPPTFVAPTPAVSTVASIPTPMGLDMAADGTMYVSDGGGARLLRVNPSGAVFPYAYGLSTSYGLAIDGDNNRYVTLSTANAILKVSPDDRTTRPFAVGIANPYGLTYRNGYLYASHPDTGGITRFDLQGNASSYGQGLRYGNTGLDVGADGTAWANRYATLGAYNANPVVGDDQDGNWRNFAGILAVPPGGARWDVFDRQNVPQGLAVKNGVVYLTNYQNQLVKVTPTGVTNAFRLEVVDGTLTKPRGVAMDKDGLVLVADNAAGQVYRYDPAAGHARTAVGNPLAGVFAVAADPGDNTLYAVTNPGSKLYKLVAGTWTEILTPGNTFNAPTGLAVTPSHLVAIADRSNRHVKTVNPADGSVVTLARPNFSPYNVAVQSSGLIVVSCDTNTGAACIRYDAAGTSFTELHGLGSMGFFPMAIDPADDKIYSANCLAEVRISNSTRMGGTHMVVGEVLADATGRYAPTPNGFYKFGENGAPDLHLNLGAAGLGFASIGGSVYVSTNNKLLYQVTDTTTGANTKLTTTALPDNALALDARTDGVLEFIGSADPKLYRMKSGNTLADMLPVGLRKPDF